MCCTDCWKNRGSNGRKTPWPRPARCARGSGASGPRHHPKPHLRRGDAGEPTQPGVCRPFNSLPLRLSKDQVPPLRQRATACLMRAPATNWIRREGRTIHYDAAVRAVSPGAVAASGGAAARLQRFTRPNRSSKFAKVRDHGANGQPCRSPANGLGLLAGRMLNACEAFMNRPV
jgi:hypothetical protein